MVSDIEVLDKVLIEQARIALVSFQDSFITCGPGHETRNVPGHARIHGRNRDKGEEGKVTVSDYAV